ncbi:MAG: hypothetical protein HYT87_14935 [Nitrospirae bacterium]|nr:hypothetical protein [Nitrospirota bacterium]
MTRARLDRSWHSFFSSEGSFQNALTLFNRIGRAFWEFRPVQARKEHRCDCRAKIREGETYYQNEKEGMRIPSTRVCKRCLVRMLGAALPLPDETVGQLAEYARERKTEELAAAVDRLRFPAQSKTASDAISPGFKAPSPRRKRKGPGELP